MSVQLSLFKFGRAQLSFRPGFGRPSQTINLRQLTDYYLWVAVSHFLILATWNADFRVRATAKIINFSLLFIHNRYKFALSLVMIVYLRYSDSVIMVAPSEMGGGELNYPFN